MQAFIFPFRIYADDTDYGGIVYHANYLKFMEHARTEWAYKNQVDFMQLAKEGAYFVVRAAKIDYLKPARLHDELVVVTQIAKVGRASIIYEHVIQAANNPEYVYCTGEIVVVCINQQAKPRSIPDNLLKVVRSYE